MGQTEIHLSGPAGPCAEEHMFHYQRDEAGWLTVPILAGYTTAIDVKVSRRISRRGLIAGGLAFVRMRCLFSRLDTSQTISTHLGLEITSYSVCCVQIRSNLLGVSCDPFFTHLPFHQVYLGNVGY